MSTSADRKKLLLIIMDGFGLRDEIIGNAIAQAHTETLTDLMANYPCVTLQAAGEAVGTLAGDVGNSEVGHNAMGAGQIIAQGQKQVQQMFEDGSAFQTDTWRGLIANVKTHNSTLHFIGLFSDGNVHANIHHLFAMMRQAQAEGISKIRVHPAFDGRDTPPESAEHYVKMFEDFVHELGDPDYKLADGIGRMVGWMDRYENDWGMIERGWDIAVDGHGPQFTDATDAVLTLRAQEKPSSDQFLPPFVIVDDAKQPIGLIKPGDSVVYYNFRADRSIQSAMSFVYNDFDFFERRYPDGTPYKPSDIYFAGMAEYNNTTGVPEHKLTPQIEINHTLSDTLTRHGISQYAITETVKYGHLTYYFDGNHYLAGARRSDGATPPSGDPSDTLHTYVEIESDTDTSRINTRPWMKAAEITDTLIEAMKSGKYDFIRVNYPNGDMVGHFGELEPGIIAVETVDICMKRLLAVADELDMNVIITADHGNVEEVTDTDGNPVTAHTAAPVPCIFYNRENNIGKKYFVSEDPRNGLANLAATITTLLDIPPDSKWLTSVLTLKK